jgi:hypothetical protein
MHEGKPYRGVGVNYFDAFYRTLSSGSDTSYRAGFSYLKSRGIPFIRFMACGFWPKQWKLYQKNKAEYFARLDSFIKAAEKYKIGLIPSLFWNISTIPDLVGEPVDQWGNPDSKTIAFMKTYTRELVMRYHDSPAIWGWEFGNEMNLETDLPGEHFPPVTVENGTPPKRSPADKLSTGDMITALTEFAKTVRLYDASRIIISGNSNPRPSAYHLYTDHSWGRDSINNYGYMLGVQNPDPVNTISVHIYPDQEFQYFTGNPASLKDIIRAAMGAARQMNKPLFIGEFGSPLTLGTEKEHQKFKELLNDIKTSKVPLAALWVFDYTPQDKDWNVTIHSRQYQLDEIAELNKGIH